MTLGLHKHKVDIVEYDTKWHAYFEDEKTIIISHIGEYVKTIQHIGSTAIPGLPSKPIIDIGILADLQINITKIKSTLIKNSYIYRGDAGQDGGILFVKEVMPLIRTHHLHIIGIGDRQWENYIRFRDALINDPTLALAYKALKLELLSTYSNDRKMYTKSKAGFINKVLQDLA